MVISINNNNIIRYAEAPTKGEKSNIMSSIIACVRAASGHGGFIKRDKKTGLWWEVGKLTYMCIIVVGVFFLDTCFTYFMCGVLTRCFRFRSFNQATWRPGRKWV
jgi:hypothetical protein